MHALRISAERPDFELAGVRVYDEAKVGLGAGALLDSAPTGLLAANDLQKILALDADCVCYSPLGGSRGAVDDICRLLASGKCGVERP